MINIKRIFRNKGMVGCDYPRVVYDDVVFKRNMASWASFVGCKSLELLLLNLGFKVDDTIYLHSSDYDDNIYYSIGEDNIDIKNKINLKLYNPIITIDNGKDKIAYDCITDKEAENGFILHKVLHEEKLSDKLFVKCQYFSLNDGYEFKVINGDYSLNLVIYLKDNVLGKFVDVLELKQYLISLEYPVAIDEVYKRICEISLVNMDDCSMFKLEISKKKSNEYGNEISDLVIFDNGEFKKFGMTKDGKKLFLYSDGSWEYQKEEDGKIKYLVNSNTGMVNYSVFASNDYELGGYMRTLAEYDINRAKSDVGDAKKLIKTMFGNSKRYFF